MKGFNNWYKTKNKYVSNRLLKEYYNLDYTFKGIILIKNYVINIIILRNS